MAGRPFAPGFDRYVASREIRSPRLQIVQNMLRFVCYTSIGTDILINCLQVAPARQRLAPTLFKFTSDTGPYQGINPHQMLIY